MSDAHSQLKWPLNKYREPMHCFHNSPFHTGKGFAVDAGLDLQTKAKGDGDPLCSTSVACGCTSRLNTVASEYSTSLILQSGPGTSW